MLIVTWGNTLCIFTEASSIWACFLKAQQFLDLMKVLFALINFKLSKNSVLCDFSGL